MQGTHHELQSTIESSHDRAGEQAPLTLDAAVPMHKVLQHLQTSIAQLQEQNKNHIVSCKPM